MCISFCWGHFCRNIMTERGWICMDFPLEVSVVSPRNLQQIKRLNNIHGGGSGSFASMIDHISEIEYRGWTFWNYGRIYSHIYIYIKLYIYLYTQYICARIIYIHIYIYVHIYICLSTYVCTYMYNIYIQNKPFFVPLRFAHQAACTAFFRVPTSCGAMTGTFWFFRKAPWAPCK